MKTYYSTYPTAPARIRDVVQSYRAWSGYTGGLVVYTPPGEGDILPLPAGVTVQDAADPALVGVLRPGYYRVDREGTP